MTEPDPSAWLASIAEIFDELGVDWALVGALAANRYRATPRFTVNIDGTCPSLPPRHGAAPTCCRMSASR